MIEGEKKTYGAVRLTRPPGMLLADIVVAVLLGVGIRDFSQPKRDGGDPSLRGRYRSSDGLDDL